MHRSKGPVEEAAVIARPVTGMIVADDDGAITISGIQGRCRVGTGIFQIPRDRRSPACQRWNSSGRPFSITTGGAVFPLRLAC